jgi:hypothetical protein
MSQKPNDVFGVSLCRKRHIVQHRLSVDALTANTEPIFERSPPSSLVSVLTSICLPH